MNFRAGLLFLLFLVMLGTPCPTLLEAQPRLRPPASYVQPTPPDKAEGSAILERSREVGLTSPPYLEFDLRILPRRGQSRSVSGRWFGGRNAEGPLTRVELVLGGGVNEIILVQRGRQPSVWSGKTGQAFARLDGAGASDALAGSQLSAVDLQTPFMFWTDHVYEGLERFRGRPTHVFLLYPPEDEEVRYPGIGGARVYIDTAYGAISQAQWLDPAGTPLKTITILDLKKIGEQWIVKTFEVRDERTRDKTRFIVTAAAPEVDVPAGLFTPDEPAQATAFQVPDGQIVSVR